MHFSLRILLSAHVSYEKQLLCLMLSLLSPNLGLSLVCPNGQSTVLRRTGLIQTRGSRRWRRHASTFFALIRTTPYHRDKNMPIIFFFSQPPVHHTGCLEAFTATHRVLILNPFGFIFIISYQKIPSKGRPWIIPPFLLLPSKGSMWPDTPPRSSAAIRDCCH